MDDQGDRVPVGENEGLEATQDPREELREREEESDDDVVEGAAGAQDGGAVHEVGGAQDGASHVVAAAEPAMPEFMQLLLAQFQAFLKEKGDRATRERKELGNLIEGCCNRMGDHIQKCGENIDRMAGGRGAFVRDGVTRVEKRGLSEVEQSASKWTGVEIATRGMGKPATAEVEKEILFGPAVVEGKKEEIQIESIEPTIVEIGIGETDLVEQQREEKMENVQSPCSHHDAVLNNPNKDLQVVLERRRRIAQMYGWLLLGLCSIFIFGVMCVKACRSPRGYLQDVYRHQYRAHERSLFDHTSEHHARALAASNVKRFFGYLAVAPPKPPPTAQASRGLCVPGAVIGSGPVDVPELGLIPGEQFEVVSGLMGRCSRPWADRYYSELHYWAENSCSLGK
uniref:uncharacterized protein isoform X1 n=1 Tax=Myxine glutinosa TaxID=7769 RepID=UPI00358F2CE8